MAVSVPEPPSLPLLGHLREVDLSFPLSSFTRLSDIYGEIFRLRLGGKRQVFVSTNELVNEACDEKRFAKKVITSAVLSEVRNAVHDGLFTAEPSEEPNWGIAHRILMPAFGPMSIKNMYPEMHDLASQLALKWARFGSETPITVTDDFTRLTLDTISLCAMDFRFNSFYMEKLHPFLDAMADFLVESGGRAFRPAVATTLMRGTTQKYFDDIELMRRTAREVLEHRRQNPADTKDLLNAMMNGVDSKTGQKMTDESVIDNLITFLVAGHETTSGLLSFAFYELIKHPDAYRKAQEEVDRVVGTGPLKVDHLPQLPYLAAVLRETLRLCSPIPFLTVSPLENQTMGGKYEVTTEDTIIMLLAKAHLDPKVYGDDSANFRPERMLDAEFNRLTREFPNCWKPFGNGIRACIGRPFAWQEALIVVAVLLQNFNFVLSDPSYELKLKQTLTIKPKEFSMRAILRDGLTATALEHRLAGTVPPAKINGVSKANGDSATTGAQKGKPVSIFFGSNSGTCESMAQRLASDAPSHGFYAKTVDSLDAAKENLPKDHPVVFITASYEGEPPDNASHFVGWIGGAKADERPLKGVVYATFGAGHRDWTQTFYRIPKLVDSTLEMLGAERITTMGLTDAASGDMFTDFESWEDEVFWPAVTEKYGIDEDEALKGAEGADVLQASVTVKVSTPRSTTLRQDVKPASVVESRLLTVDGEPAKKHLEIKLPEGMSYSTGDYLAVLPLNPQENIERAMRIFHLPRDAHIEITSTSGAAAPSSLPTDSPVPAHDVLGAYVELGQPATKRNVLALSAAATSPATKAELQKLAGPRYADEISAKRVSVLDLLERYPGDKEIKVSLGTFLSMLSPMRVRQYSISSSPLWNPEHVTLTYSILDAPSLSGVSGRRHQGVASSYLSTLSTGDAVHVVVRPAKASAFHPPQDVASTPVIMICAGTGLAPFRGFVQERAALAGAGGSRSKLAPALLYHGCRAPGRDELYADELNKWNEAGVVSVRRAFSREPEHSDGCRHVQDLLWKDREEIRALWDQGAKVYVCGSRQVGESVREAAIKIAMDGDEIRLKREAGKEITEETMSNWYESLRNVRFATDVFD